MSRIRSISVPILTLALVAVMVSCASSTAGPVDDLEKQVKALTERVNNLEKQLQALKTTGGQPNAAAEQEAQAALSKINQMVLAGDVAQAKTQLVEFQKKYGSTRTGRQGQRLAQELAIVGKTKPADWGIEKWFQGQSDIDLNGNKTTVVVFWETWCPHCRREVPKLQKMYDTYKGKGLQLVGLTKVNRSATEETVKSFIAENKLSYPIAKENGNATSHFGVSGVPAAAVLKNGKVVWRGHPVRITDDMLKGWL